MEPTTAALILAWVAIAIFASALVGLVVRLAELERFVKLGSGGQAPAALQPSETTSLDLFLSTSCAVCAAIARRLAILDDDELRDRMRIMYMGAEFESIEQPAGFNVIEDARSHFEGHGVETTPTVIVRTPTHVSRIILTSTAHFERVLSEFTANLQSEIDHVN